MNVSFNLRLVVIAVALFLVSTVTATAAVAQVDSTDLTIRARGTAGLELVQVRIGNEVVEQFTASTRWEEVRLAVDSSTSFEDISVGFMNNHHEPVDHNLLIDWVQLGSERRQSESSNVWSTGKWTSATGCTNGPSTSQTLHCAGFFHFGGQQNGSVVEAHAVGSTGTESLELQLDGVAVANHQVALAGNVWDSRTATAPVRFTLPEDVDHGRIRLAFVNDGNFEGVDRNLRIDRIVVDGVSYETKDPRVESLGAWSNGARCGQGFFETETLACNGWFQLPESATGASNLTVRAQGSTGSEQLHLEIDGEVVHSWIADESFSTTSYSHATPVTGSQVRVRFSNDGTERGRDRNVTVDYLTINEERFESDHPLVVSRGAWGNGARCQEGVFEVEFLACNGWFQYSDDGGTSSAQDPVSTPEQEVDPVSTPEQEVDPASTPEPVLDPTIHTLEVRALGSTGEEQLELLIGDSVARFQLSTDMASYFYTHRGELVDDEVRVEFVNNGRASNGADRNARVDFLRVDGVTFQSEDPDVFSTGTYSQTFGCDAGSKQSEWLHCGGYFKYDLNFAGPTAPPTGVEVSESLGRGINFGNSLEAPREGDWGARLEADFFEIVAEAGFDHVRLPVSWAGYADTEAPYTIPDGVDPNISNQRYSNIWDRIDWAIDQAEANNLMIIVNMHHYNEAHRDPAGHRDRIIAIWEQISLRYADAGDHVVFELFNEPNGVFNGSPELWNELLADLHSTVRETNPTRTLIIGPVGYNSIDRLDDLALPQDDHVIATVHIYEPFDFTHQGAYFLDTVPALGVPWSPDGLGLRDGLHNRSWDTRAITEDGRLRIDFGRQWAGFSLDYLDSVGPHQVSFRASGDGTVRLGCRAPSGNQLDQARIAVTDQPQQFTIDLSGCPSDATGISIMNQDASLNPLFISDLEICSLARGCEQSYTSADQSLRRFVERAKEWSDRSGVPVHIGEFGAFSADGRVAIADRAAWTATVADEASEQGIPFSYWEFHAGYAAYDLERDAWNEELLEALLGAHRSSAIS